MKPKEYDAVLRRAIKNDPRTAKQLAVDAGVPAPSVTLYLRRKRSLSWTTACRLLSTLRIGLQQIAPAINDSKKIPEK